MKSLLLVVMGLLLIGTVANAAEIIADDPGAGVPGVVTPDSRWAYSITQNLAPIGLNNGGYSCGNVLYSYVTNAYSMRRFSLYWDNAISDPFDTGSVQWGIIRFQAWDSIPPAGSVIIPGPYDPYSVSVILYSIPSDSTMTFGHMTVIDSVLVPLNWPEDHPVTPALGVAKTTEFPGLQCFDPEVDGVIYDLVVAVHNPPTYNMTHPVRFAVSANNIGQTAYPYYAFADCGFPEPATPAELNAAAPDAAQMVLIVNGDLCVAPPPGACCDIYGVCTLVDQAACVAPSTWNGAAGCTPNPCPPVPTQTKSWGQVKSLYR